MGANLIATGQVGQQNLRQETRMGRAIATFVGIGITMLVLMASLPVKAADQDKTIRNDDQIVLTLAAEDFITAEKPLVTINIDAAFQDAEQGRIRGDVLDALKKLDSNADWKITSMNRRTDRSGLVQWSVLAEARLDQNSLSGLEDRANKRSRGGFTLRLGNVNWTPTLAESEAGLRKLRGELYKQAIAERNMLNDVFGTTKFRVGLIDFVGTGPLVQSRPKVQAAPAMMRMAEADAGFAPQNSLSVSQKLQLKATVVIVASDETQAQD